MLTLTLLAVAALYILLVLVGSYECFEGTAVGKVHYALTDGICDALESVVRWVFGQRGADCLDATEACCCQGSNPLGQLFFLALLGGCYWGVWSEVFPLLPAPGLPAWHQYTGTCTALLVLALFSATCFTDPGVVTAADVAAHNALYPPDNVLYEPRACATCLQAKPARSKHCRATKACVARYDHWCIWVNNAVGLYNTRWFLGFLLSTTIAAFYGALVSAMAVAADMQRQGAWGMAWTDSRTGQLVGLEDRWGLLFQYVVSEYSTAAGVAAFLAIACWIVLGFTVLQLYRVACGVTTNEVFKWKDLAAGLKAAAAADGAAPPAGDVRRGAAAAPHAVQLPRHVYHRGWWRNFSEILLPRWHLAKALSERRNAKRD